MDPIGSIIDAAFGALDIAQSYNQYAKQAKELRDELQTEVTLTMTMLRDLRDIAREISYTDENELRDTIAPPDPPPGQAQNPPQPGGVDRELKDLQTTVKNICEELKPVVDSKEKSWKRVLARIFQANKDRDRTTALLGQIRSVQRNVDWLTKKIPMYVCISHNLVHILKEL